MVAGMVAELIAAAACTTCSEKKAIRSLAMATPTDAPSKQLPEANATVYWVWGKKSSAA
jgi:hypothetical protein